MVATALPAMRANLKRMQQIQATDGVLVAFLRDGSPPKNVPAMLSLDSQVHGDAPDPCEVNQQAPETELGSAFPSSDIRPKPGHCAGGAGHLIKARAVQATRGHAQRPNSLCCSLGFTVWVSGLWFRVKVLNLAVENHGQDPRTPWCLGCKAGCKLPSEAACDPNVCPQTLNTPTPWQMTKHPCALNPLCRV